MDFSPAVAGLVAGSLRLLATCSPTDFAPKSHLLEILLCTVVPAACRGGTAADDDENNDNFQGQAETRNKVVE